MADVLRTDFLVSDKELKKVFRDQIESSEEVYLSAAWVTEDHSVYRSLLKSKDNIKKFFCGVSGYITSPEVLEDFKDHPNFYIVDDTELFHHKAYMFVKGEQTTVICGSPNLTWKAFGANDEIVQCTTIDGRIDLFKSIEFQIKHKLRRVTPEFVDKYREDFRLAKEGRERDERERSHLSYTYAHYSWEKMRDVFHRTEHIEERLQLLSDIQRDMSQDFNFLTEAQRKRIAGTLPSSQNMEGYDAKWFGNMSGSGVFAHAVIEQADKLSDLLKLIPLRGEVSEVMFNQFCTEFRKGFNWENPLSTATRLLSMRRPDYFLCVTSANRDKLALDFGFRSQDLDLSSYWNLVLGPIQSSRWWKEAYIDVVRDDLKFFRVALLDCLYYEAN